MLYRTILFLVLNFAGLGIAAIFTADGVPSEWYASLEKAPWTPPGWAFGPAWTIIMVCYAIYMALAWPLVDNRPLLLALYSGQWVLNAFWSPVFFYFHAVGWALLIISALTILIITFWAFYEKILKQSSFLLLPYLSWLLIATSLNGYVLWFN